MKKTKLLIITLFSALLSFGQYSNGFSAPAPRVGAELQPTYLTNMLSRPIKLMDIPNLSGSPYLSNEFKPGFVKIKSGYWKQDVPIRFNIFQNALEFKQGDKEMELDSLDMAIYLETPGDSSSMHMIKTGYPAIDNHTEQSIYEVLAMGDRAHLLKYNTQKIEEVKSMGEFGKKEISTVTNYYIYKPGQGIFKIKLNVSSVTQLFPEEADKINKLVKESKLNLKNEAQLAGLITVINKLASL